MDSRAQLKYYRSSPRKVRLVADMVRGQAVEPALTSLQLSPKFAAKDVAKLLRSALANLEQAQPGVDVDRVFISKIAVDGGPSLDPREIGRLGIQPEAGNGEPEQQILVQLEPGQREVGWSKSQCLFQESTDGPQGIARDPSIPLGSADDHRTVGRAGNVQDWRYSSREELRVGPIEGRTQ